MNFEVIQEGRESSVKNTRQTRQKRVHVTMLPSSEAELTQPFPPQPLINVPVNSPVLAEAGCGAYTSKILVLRRQRQANLSQPGLYSEFEAS